jgi:hypothetical protein
MTDTTNHLSRAEKIAGTVIARYTEFGLISSEYVEGIIRGLDLLPCSIETLSDTQIVDIVGRLLSVHAQASRYAHTKHDVTDPTVVKMTQFVIERLDK